MMKYNIDWYLSFKGRSNSTFVDNLIKTLGLGERHIVEYDGNLTYIVRRSLDICLPIILTKAIGHRVDIFRDCSVDKFIILISD